MKKGYVILLLFLLPMFVMAHDNLRLPEIRSLALGNNGVTQSCLYNPSLITFPEKPVLSMNYFNRYGLKELGSMNVGFQYPHLFLPVAFHLYSFGYDAYRETMFRVSMAKRLHTRWTIGLAFHYSLLETELYEEHKARLSVDIGATFSPFENLLIGMLIMNTPSVSIGNQTIKNKDFKGYMMQFGFEWKFINNLLIIGTLGADRENPLTGSVGLEYQAFDSFYLRSGMEMKPFMPSFGVGYRLQRFSMDVAAVYHPVLGASTGLGLSFSF